MIFAKRLSTMIITAEREGALPSLAAIALAALIALGIAGCSTPQQQTTIAALELALASAEAGAQAYRALPPCSEQQGEPCKHLEMVAKLQELDTHAYLTLRSARDAAASGATVDFTASIAAITALQAVVNSATAKPLPK